MNSQKVVFVVGLTASGKTSLSLELAKKFNGEIIGADSRQIYKYLIIGSASPALEDARAWQELKETGKLTNVEGIPHHLFHFLSPKKSYSAALYKRRALKKIREVWERGRVPFVVGGTGLYIASLVDNLVFPRVAPNPELRDYLQKKDVETLFNIYKELDPLGANFIERENKRRLVRAIEVCLVTKKPFWSQRKKGKPLFSFLEIAPAVSMTALKEKIKKRTRKMLEWGLKEEVEGLLQRYDWSAPGLQAIGYKEFRGYFEGEKSLEEVEREITRNTWRYARYQKRWFQRDKRIYWVKSLKEASSLVQRFLQERD